jgi:hypothetical protein
MRPSLTDHPIPPMPDRGYGHWRRLGADWTIWDAVYHAEHWPMFYGHFFNLEGIPTEIMSVARLRKKNYHDEVQRWILTLRCLAYSL